MKKRNQFHKKQFHFSKEQLVQLMVKPKKLKLTGSESVDKLLDRKA